MEFYHKAIKALKNPKKAFAYLYQRYLKNPKKNLASLCERYLDFYNGFSYDFDKNGERHLLQKLHSFNMETIFDVGANIGEWTLIAQRLFSNARIHCFELSESTFGILSSNIAATGGGGCLFKQYWIGRQTG